MIRRLATALCVVLLSACASAPRTQPPPSNPAPSTAPSTATSASPSKAGATKPATRSTGWTVTVYYTAVQSLHSGTPTTVTGCPTINCGHGHADLGSYPADFVRAVRDEGTGRTSDGRYLNWSSDTGYWLDTAPRDSYGGVLQPFRSAAADPTVLKRGTAFTIADCGHADDGSAIQAPVCTRLRAAHWTIADEFTPGLGGAKHIDAYIGEETGRDFTSSDWYTTLTSAVLLVQA